MQTRELCFLPTWAVFARSAEQPAVSVSGAGHVVHPATPPKFRNFDSTNFIDEKCAKFPLHCAGTSDWQRKSFALNEPAMEQAPESQPDALSAGRRIYLGNLPYTAKPHDIEEVLATNGFGHLENIHISIDPVSARNPGYCFVDFPNSAIANHALTSLSAAISGRPIRVGPCEPKKQHDCRWNSEDDFAFQRWGDWISQYSDSEIMTCRLNNKGIEQGPYGALDHFDHMVQNYEGRRLYVGGLGKMINQAQHNRDISEILAGFTPTAIGKRITPHENMRSIRGNHHYCFVDFETREETNAAMKALNGRPIMGGKLKVALAGDIPKTLVNPHTDGRYVRCVYDEGYLRPNSSRSENMAGSNRAIASSDWRRRDYK